MAHLMRNRAQDLLSSRQHLFRQHDLDRLGPAPVALSRPAYQLQHRETRTAVGAHHLECAVPAVVNSRLLHSSSAPAPPSPLPNFLPNTFLSNSSKMP